MPVSVQGRGLRHQLTAQQSRRRGDQGIDIQRRQQTERTVPAFEIIGIAVAQDDDRLRTKLRQAPDHYVYGIGVVDGQAVAIADNQVRLECARTRKGVPSGGDRSHFVSDLAERVLDDRAQFRLFLHVQHFDHFPASFVFVGRRRYRIDDLFYMREYASPGMNDTLTAPCRADPEEPAGQDLQANPQNRRKSATVA